MEYKKYYEYLVNVFGNANYSGCVALAHILSMYEPGLKLKDLYQEYAIETNTTVASIKQRILIYLNSLLDKYSIQDIAEVLDYSFKPEQKTLCARELIPILKLRIDAELS